MKFYFVGILLLVSGFPITVWAQIAVAGRVVDAANNQSLIYVNIGLRDKNVGTVTKEGGVFKLLIPDEYEGDTLRFSMVGYQDHKVALRALKADTTQRIALTKKDIALDEVEIVTRKPIERRFGIKRRNLLIHFADGMFQPDDSFEIGQLLKLGAYPVKLHTLNLYLLDDRPDSASFRINFYRYREGKPAERLIERSIIQRKAITKGWLSFDLSKENLRLSGDVVATLEFLPDLMKEVKPISYEVKLGGTSKSFYRRSSMGPWNTPPHHYCLNLSGMADREAPPMPDEEEGAAPAFEYASAHTNTRYSIFVQLPADYERNKAKRYPLLVHLDGNAYFDAISAAVSQQRGDDSLTPIVVGIGYENAYIMDSLRVRDDTFPEALAVDSFATSGGGEAFYAFITQELIPHLDRIYRTQQKKRTLMGHSFGGYFVLYALARQLEAERQETPAFQHYVSVSPSINYREGYLVQRLAQVLGKAASQQPSQQQLYLTMGEEELAGDTERFFNVLKEVLRSQNTLIQEIKVHKQLDHMGTAIPSFEEAIQFLYAK